VHLEGVWGFGNLGRRAPASPDFGGYFRVAQAAGASSAVRLIVKSLNHTDRVGRKRAMLSVRAANGSVFRAIGNGPASTGSNPTSQINSAAIDLLLSSSPQTRPTGFAPGLVYPQKHFTWHCVERGDEPRVSSSQAPLRLVWAMTSSVAAKSAPGGMDHEVLGDDDLVATAVMAKHTNRQQARCRKPHRAARARRS
jgi:hypothetical protein